VDDVECGRSRTDPSSLVLAGNPPAECVSSNKKRAGVQRPVPSWSSVHAWMNIADRGSSCKSEVLRGSQWSGFCDRGRRRSGVGKVGQGV
jgi:hypothetical protein